MQRFRSARGCLLVPLIVSLVFCTVPAHRARLLLLSVSSVLVGADWCCCDMLVAKSHHAFEAGT
eukprot:9178350-Alexandrium_andersonii.AAC.1